MTLLISMGTSPSLEYSKTANRRFDISSNTTTNTLAMPMVEEPRAGLWALGSEAGGKALATATLPDIELADVDGRPFRFTSLRGRKALILAWASW